MRVLLSLIYASCRVEFDRLIRSMHPVAGRRDTEAETPWCKVLLKKLQVDAFSSVLGRETDFSRKDCLCVFVDRFCCFEEKVFEVRAKFGEAGCGDFRRSERNCVDWFSSLENFF